MTLGDQMKAHVEAYLGATPSRFTIEDSLGVRVATFEDVPSSGLTTSITIGVSGHRLQQPLSKRAIRQELMTCVENRYSPLPWHEILLSTGKILLNRHAALMLGEVIGPAGPLFPEATWCRATALICALPAFFTSDFAELESHDGITMVFVELIPITTAEARWVDQYGWSAFFDRVNGGEIDILDLSRE